MSLIASEGQEQAAFVAWFRLTYPYVLIHSIPNGMHLSGDPKARARKMGKLKATGLVPGMPDLFVPSWLLWVEMKRSKGGRLSGEQEAVISYLREAVGHKVIVAEGWDDARRQVEEWTGP